MQRWLVFWVKGGRIGSLPLTEENLAVMKRLFYMSLIQRDLSGTEHWEILTPRRKRGKRA